MKTIKIIDIVKLIEEKNYENLPKKIKINNKTYEFDKTDNDFKKGRAIVLKESGE